MAPKSNNKKKAKDTANSSSKRGARVSLSPPSSGTKRKQEEEDGEPERRVSQRTEEAVIKEEKATNQEEENWKESMEKILQHDLCSTDMDVVEEAMKVLVGILCADDDSSKVTERQNYFFFLGGHYAVVVGVMNARPNLSVLQCCGIAVLVNAAATENQEHTGAIVAVKGLGAIITAMENYSYDVMQADGMQALINLLYFHEANANLFVTKHGGIPFLLQRMKIFPNNVELIEQACLLLKYISSFDKFRKSLVDAKAVSVLARAFDCHANNNDIRGWARDAIHNIMGDSTD